MADPNQDQKEMADPNQDQNQDHQLVGNMLKYIIRDALSDVTGFIGLNFTLLPFMDGISQFIKLIGGFGGLVLLYLSIKYKIELIKEKKIQNSKSITDDKTELK